MHLTIMLLKGGKEISGCIERQRLDPDIFENSYIKLFDHKPIYIKDLSSAITKGERISISEIADMDEVKHMRKLWDDYKKGMLQGISVVEPEYKLK